MADREELERLERDVGRGQEPLREFKPAIDVATFCPVESWEGGPLRVYRDPLMSSKLEPARPYAPYGVGYAVPVSDSLLLPDGVRLHVALVDGVLRCTGIVVDTPPIDPYEESRAPYGIATVPPRRWLTSKYVRSLAFEKRVARWASQMLGVRLYRRPRGEIIGVRVGAPKSSAELWTTAWDQRPDVRELTQLAQQRRGAARDPSPRRGRKPLSDDRIAEAGAIATAAVMADKPPAWAIEKQMTVQPSTAKKYLRLARERNLAPPSTRSKRKENDA